VREEESSSIGDDDTELFDATVEREEAREARAHLEKLISVPDCALLAARIELERVQTNARTLAARRERKLVQQNAVNDQISTHRRHVFILNVLQILSYTGIAISVTLAIKGLICRPSHQTQTTIQAISSTTSSNSVTGRDFKYVIVKQKL
jgi:hypothetical protein